MSCDQFSALLRQPFNRVLQETCSGHGRDVINNNNSNKKKNKNNNNNTGILVARMARYRAVKS